MRLLFLYLIVTIFKKYFRNNGKKCIVISGGVFK